MMAAGEDGRRVAVVSGGSRGIGAAICRGLADDGYSLAVVARGVADLERVKSELGGRCSIHAADVSIADEAARVAAEICDLWSDPEVLVTCAGSGRSLAPGRETAAEWSRMMNVNFLTAANVITALQPALERRGGRIVCVSSICGIEALGAPVPYSAAKSALNALVVGLSNPLGRHGVRINAVAPGNILFEGGTWDVKSKADPEAVQRMLSADVPLGRFGTPDEISDAVRFLVSSKSSFITGACLVVDGGQTRT